MKKVAILVLAALALSIGALGYKLATDVPARAHVSNGKLGSIVRLVLNGQTFCSGTVVTPTVIITAAHCVLVETPFGNMLRSGPIEIRGADNVPQGVFARPAAVVPQMDQAMLVGDFPIFSIRDYITNPLQLTKLREKGDLQMISCGYPLHGDIYCTPLKYKAPLDFMWSVEGVLLPGMSGGPAMLLDGTVVGVNVAVEKEFSVISPIYNLNPSLIQMVK